MTFCTLLHSLKSPQNVGMIIRSHAAHAGHEVIFTGQALPWQFKKGTEAFSRKLEKQTSIQHIPDPDKAIEYLRRNGFSIVALEISEQSQSLNKFTFPEKTALVVGNEATGLPTSFIKKTDHTVTIPQYAAIGSLNVAVSASIAMYELMKGKEANPIIADEYV